MCTQKSLSLPDRFESPHPSFPTPGRFMRLLGAIVLILLGTVNCLGYQFSMGYAITPQFISHDLPGLTATRSQQASEEELCCCAIAPGLQEYINNFTILIDGPPQAMLLAVDPYEYLIDVESIAIAPVLSLQSSGVYSPELDTPEADGLSTDSDTPFG